MTGFNGLQQVINYMVPAVGVPRGYFWNGVLTGAPVTIDFRNVSGGGIDGQVFRPSGVFIDNTQGTGPVTVVVNEIGYQMICLEGELLNLQFPAPVECTVSFVGDGQATLAFVDFPVLPYRNIASSAGAALWGSIAGVLSDQTDLQTALDAKMADPMTTQGDIIFRGVSVPSRLAIGTDGQVLTVVSGVPAWDDLPPAVDPTDLIARAGATRFIVFGTFDDSADAGTSALRNVVVSDADGRGGVAGTLAVTGMDAISTFSTYFEFNMATLPTSTIGVLTFEDDNTGDAFMDMEVNTDGSLSIYRDAGFSSTADSAAGVIVAGTHHKIVVSYDATSSGGVIQVCVDGVLVINSTSTDARTTGTDMLYRLGKFGAGLTGTDNWYSRYAYWSTNLSPSDALALSSNGNLTAYEVPDLRIYWPLDETSGAALPDIGSGNLSLANFATWGTATAFSPASVGQAARVGTAGTNDFTGHDNQIAVMLASGWAFVALQEGLQCYDQSDNTETLWNGSTWG